MNHFDTFKRPIVIYKEPIATVNSDVNYAGYDVPVSTNTTYTVVSGTYYALKVNKKSNATNDIQNADVSVNNTKITVKVLPETMDYLINGKTEYVIYNNTRYNVISQPMHQNYLGLQFYYFDLSSTL